MRTVCAYKNWPVRNSRTVTGCALVLDLSVGCSYILEPVALQKDEQECEVPETKHCRNR